MYLALFVGLLLSCQLAHSHNSPAIMEWDLIPENSDHGKFSLEALLNVDSSLEKHHHRNLQDCTHFEEMSKLPTEGPCAELMQQMGSATHFSESDMAEFCDSDGCAAHLMDLYSKVKADCPDVAHTVAVYQHVDSMYCAQDVEGQWCYLMYQTHMSEIAIAQEPGVPDEKQICMSIEGMGCCYASIMEATADIASASDPTGDHSASGAIEMVKDMCGSDHHVEDSPCPDYIGISRTGLIVLVLGLIAAVAIIIGASTCYLRKACCFSYRLKA